MMERLTPKDAAENGQSYVYMMLASINMESEKFRTFLSDCIRCLAAYEDTGLMPEQVRTLQQDITGLYLSLDEYRNLGDYDRLREICQAEQEGRLGVLTKPEETEYEGLKVKYRVFKAKDNTPVESCFVLRPEKDEAALYALMCYGLATSNMQLGEDILKWVEDIESREEAEAALKGADNEI